MSLSGSLFINPRTQFLDGNGDPYAGGKLYAYIAGTTTAQDTYSDSALTTANTNPIILDADGRLGAVYLSATGYKFQLDDANDVTIFTADNVSDPSAVFLNVLGVQLATGSTDVTSGYTITATDLTVTVASTGGADPCIINLPACSSRGMPVAIQDQGTIDVAVTPNGSDTINGVAAAFTVTAGSSPNWPTIWLWPDGVSNWIVIVDPAL